MTTVTTGTDLELIAHLLRRAGFGATRDELERYAAQGYEATVEELLNPVDVQAMPDDLIRRYHIDQSDLRVAPSSGSYWIYRMVTTTAPLPEKVALLWHRVFATGQSKLIQGKPLISQIGMYREHGMGSFRDLLVRLSKSPAMLMWLDNQDNHKDAINENYGREVLELFSMGAGNYSEDDIKECARAFTGWTVANPDYMAIKMRNNTARPYGYIAWQFEYREDDHDDGEKTFLGKTGRFNGEDVIDIICEQPATARFIARHMYHHFVADEAPVPQWPYEPPVDPDAIEFLVNAYFDSGYNVGAMLRAMFTSDFFKSEQARFARVKSPVELVVGAHRLAGGYQWPTLDVYDATAACGYMGQNLMIPPSVEGWQGGSDWISTGAMVQRVNYASKVIGDISAPGIQAIIARIRSESSGETIAPERLVELCLEFAGPVIASEETRRILVEFARDMGEVQLSGGGDDGASEEKLGGLLQLIAATREYQLA